LPVSIIADLVNDKIGNIIHNFLLENQIDDSPVYWHQHGRSRLALAFLNNCSDADYLFYKMQHEVLPEFTFPQIDHDDIFIFGSYYGIKPLIRPLIKPYIENARQNGTLILYDPNFRKSHLSILEEVRPYIEENIRLSHIVKASAEDCELIWKEKDGDKIYEIIRSFSGKYFILTQASKNVLVYTPQKKYMFPANRIKPVSTVGAGDAFMAGLTFALYQKQINVAKLESLTDENWEKIIHTAILTSSKVCLTYDNYISASDVIEVKNFCGC